MTRNRHDPERGCGILVIGILIVALLLLALFLADGLVQAISGYETVLP